MNSSTCTSGAGVPSAGYNETTGLSTVASASDSSALDDRNNQHGRNPYSYAPLSHSTIGGDIGMNPNSALHNHQDPPRLPSLNSGTYQEYLSDSVASFMNSFHNMCAHKNGDENEQVMVLQDSNGDVIDVDNDIDINTDIDNNRNHKSLS